MEPLILEIYAAQRYPHPVRPVEIRIVREMPATVTDVGDFYQQEAKTLADALYETLPQGTLHRVVLMLATRCLENNLWASC